MCGLFGGLSTSLSDNEIEKVLQLGYVSALRGTDSTGIAFGYRKEKGRFGIYTHKTLESSADYLRNDKVLSIIKTHRPIFMIGHCRAATIGDVNVENAHPHVVEHITGTHNGTIRGFGDAEKSDSRVLFERLAKEGVAKAFGAADDGAYATVFADARARTVNFFRNTQRPLWLMWDKSKQLLLWASEWGMLQMVADHDVSYERWQDPFQLKPHTLLSVPFADKRASVAEIKLEKKKAFFPASSSVESRFPNLTRMATVGPTVTKKWDSAKGMYKVTSTNYKGEETVYWSTEGPRGATDNGSSSPDRDPNWDSGLGHPIKEDEDNSCPLPEFLTKKDGMGKPLLHDIISPDPKKLVVIKGGGRYDDKYYMCTDKIIIPTSEAEQVLDIGCHGCGKSHTLENSEDTVWYSTDTFLCHECDGDHFKQLFVVGHLKSKSDEVNVG